SPERFLSVGLRGGPKADFMARPSIERCLRQPVVPAVWNPGRELSLMGRASSVCLQGGSLAELPDVLKLFEQPELADVALFVHIDLVAGLENSEAGLN